jgi:hypothetical protein
LAELKQEFLFCKASRMAEGNEMESQHRSRIISTFINVSRCIQEMEEIAIEGKSSSGGGQALSPLPIEWWKRIRVHLDCVLCECESLAESLSPVELNEHRTRAGISSTLIWLSVILGRVEEALRDICPETMEPKFGAISGEARETLTQGTTHALSAAFEARQALQTLLTPKHVDKLE